MASIFSQEEEVVSIVNNTSNFQELRDMLTPREINVARSELNRVCSNRDYLTPEVIETFKISIAQSVISQRF